jgi:hypothetical protein
VLRYALYLDNAHCVANLTPKSGASHYLDEVIDILGRAG